MSVPEKILIEKGFALKNVKKNERNEIKTVALAPP